MDNVTLRGDSSNRIVVLIADVVFYRNNRSTFAQSELLPLLIAILAFCNIILATGFFAYTLLIDVFYSVPSIDSINIDAWPLADFCYAAVKETLKHQIVHNLVNAQAIFILLITIDRYYSLFTTYDPNIRNHERSYPFAMLILISLQLFDRLAFFTELMSRNFNFEVISGDMESGVHLEDALHIWFQSGTHLEMEFEFQISHEFFLCSPLYIATVLLLVIRNYRQRLFESGRRLLRTLICADRKDKIDYACETMRSIIAKQTHAKRMKSFARPTIS
ncbi:unnamed protein product [Toxocara canis]|uniref:G protein-coupled receptor n=1 Tax=Toxocara canis TaxID=6265 RepID=A0A183UB62_TOXCA|nr:unnamed protein product [Toxocara canis]